LAVTGKTVEDNAAKDENINSSINDEHSVGASQQGLKIILKWETFALLLCSHPVFCG
jgi:hypothetical protein